MCLSESLTVGDCVYRISDSRGLCLESLTVGDCVYGISDSRGLCV